MFYTAELTLRLMVGDSQVARPVRSLGRGQLQLQTSYQLLPKWVVKPWAVIEVTTITNKILRRVNNVDDKDLIKCSDLAIDLTTCEAALSGRLIALIFKEYELLKSLASNKGEAFTRSALLNKVWGYDSYGSDRTVDARVRRARSKIEDKDHSFIETVRNTGCMFGREMYTYVRHSRMFWHRKHKDHQSNVGCATPSRPR
jgi:DNA-binding winged helix-turn-helix (wHTH) protein